MTFNSFCREIRTAVDGRVLVLELHRPGKRNALTLDMYRALVAMLEQAETDAHIRAVVIAGSETCFTSGNDIEDFLAGDRVDDQHPTLRFLDVLNRFPKPLLAAVSGHAVGIGTTMLLHCDLVFASPDAQFQLPFVNLGLCPEAGSSYLLPRLAGYQRAAEVFLLGEPFDAQKALLLGMVNAITDDVLAATTRHAHRIAANPPAAVRLTKKLLRAGDAAQVERALAEDTGQFVKRLQSNEAQEAFTAFLEKRDPDFSNFE
jgi:enoyl-CoA hydratase/carnithine racemase